MDNLPLVINSVDYIAITKAFKAFCLQDIIIGITILPCPSLNYLILIGKLFMGLQKKTPGIPVRGGGGGVGYTSY